MIPPACVNWDYWKQKKASRKHLQTFRNWRNGAVFMIVPIPMNLAVPFCRRFVKAALPRRVWMNIWHWKKKPNAKRAMAEMNGPSGKRKYQNCKSISKADEGRMNPISDAFQD